VKEAADAEADTQAFRKQLEADREARLGGGVGRSKLGVKGKVKKKVGTGRCRPSRH
jgi:hypothetical protein